MINSSKLINVDDKYLMNLTVMLKAVASIFKNGHSLERKSTFEGFFVHCLPIMHCDIVLHQIIVK